MAIRPRVLLDVDSVLADFEGSCLPLMTEITGRDFSKHEYKVWDIFESVTPEEKQLVFDRVNRPGWCESLEVLPHAVEGVKMLQTIADVYIVTSPWGHVPSWTYERERWLRKHFGIDSSKVIHTSAKYVCLGDILVDDRPDNIEKWGAAHPTGLALLWDRPNNRSYQTEAGYRVTDWEQVYLATEACQGLFARIVMVTLSTKHKPLMNYIANRRWGVAKDEIK